MIMSRESVSSGPVDRKGANTVDGSHDESYLGCIGGTGEMGVDLLGLVLVEGYEAVEDVVARGRVVRSTFSNIRSLVLPSVGSNLVQLAFIVREIILHRADR